MIALGLIAAILFFTIGVASTVGIFTAVTITTMLSVVVLSSWGLKLVSANSLQKYSHAFAGSTISLCAVGMLAFGL